MAVPADLFLCRWRDIVLCVPCYYSYVCVCWPDLSVLGLLQVGGARDMWYPRSHCYGLAFVSHIEWPNRTYDVFRIGIVTKSL